ncbi:50S ribosomal protein L10 [Patescibacteria group bacterium]
MPKSKTKKQEILKEYVEKLDNQKSTVIVNFSGLSVKDIEILRKECRKNKVSYFVAKKTLLKLALKEKGIDISNMDDIDNNIGVAFGEDEVGPAKVVYDFFEEHKEKINITSGILENKIITAEEIKSLAKLPCKEALLAKLVGTIQAPVSGFVNVLNGNIRGLVQVLNGIKENKS